MTVLLILVLILDQDQVIADHIARYRQVYEDIIRMADRMDTAIAHFFNPKGASFNEVDANFSICGTCDSLMSFRASDSVSKYNGNVLFTSLINSLH